jgi:HlyD family secretion protein
MVRTRTIVLTIVVVVVVGGIATAAIAFTASGSHAYRTATAITGSVTRELPGTGTIEPVSQATVAFPISGTVKTVDVKLGEAVATGTTLATLETTSLDSQVLSKQAALASAQLNLFKALHGEAVTGGGGSGGSGGNGRTPTTNAVTTAAVSNNTTDAAQAVVAAQHEVDIAMAAVNDALAAADTACGQKTVTQPRRGSSDGTGSPGGAGSPGGTGSHGPPPSTPTTLPTTPKSTTTTTTPASTGTPSTGIGSAACQSAQQSLYRAQQDLAEKQDALGRAENGYEKALRASNGNVENGGTGNANLGLDGGSGSNNSNSVSYSAQDLVSYQAAVDAATADVAAALESVSQATVKSPISGTVVALSLQRGAQVSAGSATANIVIAGGNGYEIATSIGVNDITQVKVGDAASVIPDGSLDRISAEVVFVGSPTNSGSSTTYPVVIGLTGAPGTLRNGAMATTTIDVSTSKAKAVLVPTSAVHDLNGRHTVSVLKDGKQTTVAVQIGVVGAQLTEITSGIDAGQTVVLADLGAAVPSSNADSRIASQFGSGLTGGGNGSTFRGP